MEALKRSHLAGRLRALDGKERIRVLNAGDGWPSTCAIHDGEEWWDADIYLGVIADAGRQNAKELRTQNPAKGDPIRVSAVRQALLVGLWAPDDGPPVIVSWDAGRRIGKTTRFSLFVPLDTVLAAQRDGRASHRNAAGENIIALSTASEGWLRAVLSDSQNRVKTDSNVREESVTDEQDEVLDSGSELDPLSEKLAALSHGEAPTSFATTSPFDATDVDWTTNAWVTRVAEVQEWLKLDGPLETSAGATTFLEGLFAMLGVQTPGECFQIEEGHARLNELGVTHLDARLDTALAHKAAFAENLENGTSVGEATRSWNEAWEDDAAIAPETDRTAVHAKVDSWQIYTFRNLAMAGGLELNPSYQRGNVWSDKESSELIDSVLRGIPLPSIILNQRKGGETLEIVDGKQRLTAILRFIGAHPDAMKFVEAMEGEAKVDHGLFHENYKKWRATVRKRRGLTTEEERMHFLPFPYRLPRIAGGADPLQALGGKYYGEIKNKTVVIEGRDETVHRLFELPMSSYKLSVIQYSDTDVHQIHKVFGLYNRQGKKLNASEVRNAIYHHLPLTRLLLLLSGDSTDAAALAPYIDRSKLDLSAIPEMLKSMNVADGRFNRTKVTSWVAALLAHPLESRSAQPVYPGSTSLVEGLMRTIADQKHHPMRGEKACELFAYDVARGAALLSDLRNQNAFHHKFTGEASGGEKWEDLPAVSAWTACTLAAIAGVTVADERITAAVRETTERVLRLTKQQARSQWGYIAKATFDLLRAMDVDESALVPVLEKRFGHNCLAKLQARRS
jgi:hypothetical protein